METAHLWVLLLACCLRAMSAAADANANACGNNNNGNGVKAFAGRFPSVEKRAARASVVLRAVVTRTHEDIAHPRRGAYVAECRIIDVYKGADKLAAAIGLRTGSLDASFRHRHVNVSGWGDAGRCWSAPSVRKEYILLLAAPWAAVATGTLVAKYDAPFGAAVDYTKQAETSILKALGWLPFGDWSSCSASCGGGSQWRARSCVAARGRCSTYNRERRACNTFACQGAVNTLSVRLDRYFKPSSSAFEHVAARAADAWTFRPGSYLLLPFRQAFAKSFPRDFAVLITLRPNKDSEGILFSVNSRTSRQEYLSLELSTGGRLQLVHAYANGSTLVNVAHPLEPNRWQQVALGLAADGRRVSVSVDCNRPEMHNVAAHRKLRLPVDPDVVVGYMFQGEIEQLTVVGDPRAAARQCGRDTAHDFAIDVDGDGGNNAVGSAVDSGFSTDGDIAIEDDDKSKHTSTSLPSTSSSEEYVDLDWSENSVARASPAAPVEREDSVVASTATPIDTPTGSGSGVDDSDLEEAEGSGAHATQKAHRSDGAMFELEWSSWSRCTARCEDTASSGVTAASGRQSRTSRCVDNGFLEECVAAGKERTEHRTCAPPAAAKADCADRAASARPRPETTAAAAANCSGSSCSERASWCTLTCDNGGTCVNATVRSDDDDEDGGRDSARCVCAPGFHGDRCSSKKPCSRYVTVRTPRRVQVHSVVDVEYEAMCASGAVCKKTKPAFKSVTKTVYGKSLVCADKGH